MSHYVSTFCNFAHDRDDGKPIDHECVVLPRAALDAEVAGDYGLASELIARARAEGRLRVMRRGKRQTARERNQWSAHPTRLRIRQADGTEVEGCVQGSGGLMRGPDAAKRLRLAIERAGRGRDTGIAERKPGHCIVYPRYPEDDAYETAVDVDLRGAELVAEFGPWVMREWRSE